MKGRANYLCKQKLYALRDNPILSGLDDISQFHTILQWERTTETGDRAEIDELPESSALWHKLDARSEVCLGQTCPNWEPCFVTQMRRKALESDLVIVNHHLFFADLSIKQQAAGAPDAGILPEAAIVIFDEAHELEDVASQYFGIALTNHRFDELARDTESMLRAKGASSAAIESATATLRERSRLFFASLPAGASPDATLAQPGRMEFIDRADFLEAHGDSYLGAHQRTHAPRRRTRPRPRCRRGRRPAQTRRRHPQPSQVPSRIHRPQHRLLDRTPRGVQPPQRRPQRSH